MTCLIPLISLSTSSKFFSRWYTFCLSWCSSFVWDALLSCSFLLRQRINSRLIVCSRWEITQRKRSFLTTYHHHLTTQDNTNWNKTTQHNTTYHIISHHITSHHTISCHIASHRIASQQSTTQHNTSHHVTSHHITSCHIISQHNKSHHITSHHITSHHITSHHRNTQHMITKHSTAQTTQQHNATNQITLHQITGEYQSLHQQSTVRHGTAQPWKATESIASFHYNTEAWLKCITLQNMYALACVSVSERASERTHKHACARVFCSCSCSPSPSPSPSPVSRNHIPFSCRRIWLFHSCSVCTVSVSTFYIRYFNVVRNK